MKTILSILVAGGIAVMAFSSAGGGSDDPCLTRAQAQAKIDQIDTYSWYDRTDPKTIERLSPEKVSAIFKVEGRECGA
jgi:hypothetical protein